MEGYTVVIATYNGEKYLQDQLLSIIRQSVPPNEIILSDDGSKDDTLKKAREIFKANKIKYQIITNDGEHGVVGNFTNAVIHASNNIIFTSDQDDKWVENKAETILKIFEREKAVQLVFTDGYLVDSALKPLGSSMWKAVGITENKIRDKDWFNILIKNCVVTGATMAFKKPLYMENLPIPQEWLHDGWLAWMALTKNALVGLPEKLIFYRQHTANVVGMQPKKSFYKRFYNWIISTKNITQVRKIRYNRYRVLEERQGSHFNEKEHKRLKECIIFWKTLNEFPERSIMSNLKHATYLLIRGAYHRYYTGIRGYLRDILSIYLNN